MGALDLSDVPVDGLTAREWLCTCGNGSFASSTLVGLNTRKYHGLLVAAMAPPVRRLVLLSRVEETVYSAGHTFDLACNEYPGTIHPRGHKYLRAFNPDPFPRWAYQGDGWTIEKQLRPVQGENTIVLTYTLLGGAAPVELELRPLFALRGIHELMYQWNGRLDPQNLSKNHHRVPATGRSPEVYFAHDGAFKTQSCWYLNTIYRREQERGYAGLEDLWMPGAVRWTLNPGQSVHFVCSTEPIDLRKTVKIAEHQFEVAVPPLLTNKPDPVLGTLLRAAEQFVVRDDAGAPNVMSAYPWATPSGRDAMITLPGLMLVTGKIAEAKAMLASYAATVKAGLMPSDLSEEGAGYRYTAADTSLWFVNAVGEYLRYRGDEAFVQRELLPVVNQIIESYRHGTALGVGVDEDGLLRTHAPGTPTTWMDAKLGDWVVTPRQGRPVSVNALWYNALRIAADLSLRFGQTDRADDLLFIAECMQEVFNRRFWNEAHGCCYDVVEDHGFDPSLRPNQIFAVSLPYAVLDVSRHAAVVEKVQAELLAETGLRTLSPKDPGYQGHYFGPPVTRDRAYHQGSVFPWLLGPFVRAYLRVHGRGDAARQHVRDMLDGCLQYMQGDGQGQLCELFDGDPPHVPGGALASARSVAEILRSYVEDVLDLAPVNPRVEPKPGNAPAPVQTPAV
jgi:predicted glycogen debranching enzyme